MGESWAASTGVSGVAMGMLRVILSRKGSQLKSKIFFLAVYSSPAISRLRPGHFLSTDIYIYWLYIRTTTERPIARIRKNGDPITAPQSCPCPLANYALPNMGMLVPS